MKQLLVKTFLVRFNNTLLPQDLSHLDIIVNEWIQDNNVKIAKVEDQIHSVDRNSYRECYVTRHIYWEL